MKHCPNTGRLCEHTACAGERCINKNTYTYNPQTAVFCENCGGIISGVWGDSIFACTCTKEPKQLIGWECPRCFKIHSPFSLSCDCPPRTFYSGSTNLTINPSE